MVIMVLSLKFRQHMVTRTQHHQIAMKSFMANELISQHSKRAKTIQSSKKLKGTLQTLGAHAHARNRNMNSVHRRTMRD